MGFQFPHDIEGWLTPEEGEALARAAAGKRVLEVGSYLGRSTVCLAQTAETVTAVDPFDGRATAAPRDTFDEFLFNLTRSGLTDVTAYRGTSAEVLPSLPDAAYDLIFLDGDHDHAAVRADVELSRRLLAPGGVLAFHDYRTHAGEGDGRWDPGVTRAVNELLAAGARLTHRVGTIAFLDVDGLGVLPAAPSRPEPLVALVMPRGTSGIRSADAAEAFYRPTLRGVTRIPLRTSTSLAIRCFNMLLCDALNVRKQHPVTHLAMLHDDVCPEPGWLDGMLDELEASGADFLSAVVPIKNGAGVTSTAVDMVGAPWVVRRLTMHEVFDLPETFTLADIPWRLPSSRLLVNTGLWITRLDTWAEQVFPRDNPTGRTREAGLYFTDRARIVQLPDGNYVSEDISEDWEFSRRLDALGLKVAVTRKVPLYHERPEFHTRGPWGAWKQDEGYFECLRRLGLTESPAPEPEPELAEV